MGGYGDPFKEPLKPSETPPPPAFSSRFTGRKYEGRRTWWGELGYEDPVAEADQHRLQRFVIKERDPKWYDAPVKDGESFHGPFGKDSKYIANLWKKGDQPMKLAEFQDKVMKATPEYKNIVSKWKLSNEHPGIATNPMKNGFVLTEKNRLGTNYIMPSLKNRWILGPHFFDSPMDEQCVMKGFAIAKYAAIFAVPYSLYKIDTALPGRFITPWQIAKHYAKTAPTPMLVGFSWGITMCTAARYRQKDDFFNHWFASAAVAAVTHAIKDNVAVASGFGMLSLFLGLLWHQQRLTPIAGIQSPIVPQGDWDYWGPKFGDVFDLGSSEVYEPFW